MRFLIPLFLLVLLTGTKVLADDPSYPHHDMHLVIAKDGRTVTITDRIAPSPGHHATKALAEIFKVTSSLETGKTLTVSYRATLPAAVKEDSPFGPWEGAAGPDGIFLPRSANWIVTDGRPFTYTIHIEGPNGIAGLAPGTPSKDNKTYRNTLPVQGFPVIAGPYRVREKTFGKVRVMTWFHPELMALADEYIEWAGGYIDLYSQKIGSYPYDTFQIVSSPFPVGLGLPNMTYMGRNVLKLPFIRYTSLAHEVVHNWWGSGVATDYDQGNWNEGLTTFMADYALAESRKAGTARDMRFGWLRDFTALPPARDKPARTFRFKAHDAAQVVGYNKVAFFFYMLRLNLGGDVFDDGIKIFWQDNQGKVAAWPDLRRAFEKASNRHLSPFFNQWLDRKGAARLILGKVTVGQGKDDYITSFGLSQEGPLFDLYIPVHITTDKGTDKKLVRLEGKNHHFEIKTKGRPQTLAIDPDFEVFRYLDKAEAPPIFRDVTLNTNSRLVIASKDKAYRQQALITATRIFGRKPEIADQAKKGEPVLIIGPADRIKGPKPGEIGNAGIAAWMDHDKTTMTVAAKDIAALKKLARSLPHYRRYSWIVWRSSEARPDKGQWALKKSPYIRDLKGL